MSLTPTELSAVSQSGGGSVSSASVAPTAGSLVEVIVMHADSDGDTPDPGTGALSGTNWASSVSWTDHGTQQVVAFGSGVRISKFSGYAPGSVTAGVVTVTIADVEVWLLKVRQVVGSTGTPTMVQHKFSAPASNNVAAITLDSATDAGNMLIADFGHVPGLSTTYTAGTDYTKLGTDVNLAGQLYLVSEYDLTAPGDDVADISSGRVGPWVACASEIEEVAGGGPITLTVNGLSHGHTVEAPALTQANTLSGVGDLAHSHALDPVSLVQQNTLAVAGLDHAHGVEAVELTQDFVLAPADLAHAHPLGAVELTQAHNLEVADLAHGHPLEPVALTQQNTLAVAGMAHGHVLDPVTLTQAHVLALASLAHAHTVEAVALAQANILALQSLSHAHALDGDLSLTQAGTLAVASLQHAQTLDPVVLESGVTLVVADLQHGHPLDGVALTQANVLAVESLLHASGLDAVVLQVAGTLIVAGLNHSHALDGLSLVQQHVLAVAGLAHDHTLDAVALTQQNVLTVQAMAHAHALAGVTLSAGLTLAVADLLHAQALDAVALTQQSTLSVDGLQHAHALDPVSLVQAHLLAVQGLSHANALDGLTLDFSTPLAVGGLSHGHTLDPVALIQAHLLAVADLLHAQALEGVALTQQHTLAVDGLLHGHVIESVVLRLPDGSSLVSLRYAPEHASALADIRNAGAAVTLVKSTRTENPLTGRTTVATSSVAGYALRVSGEPKEYERLGLVETEAPTFLFVPTTFGDEPELGAETTFAGLTYRVRDVQAVAPDGVGVLYRLVMSLEDADAQPLSLAFGYEEEHRSALADFRAAGAAVTFTERARTETPTTGVSTVADTTIPGYAVRVRGEPDTYARLGLVAHRSVTLLFVPTTYGLRPSPGATFDWQSLLHTVREAKPVAPDGAPILSRVVGVAR